MLALALAKSKIVYFASFRKFALTLKAIQNEPSLKIKKNILQEYYGSSDQVDQRSIANILNFVREKPKIGFANKSINLYIASRFFSEMTNNNADFEQLIDQLEDDYERGDDQGSIPLTRIQTLLMELQEIQGKGSLSKKIQKLDQIVAYLSQVQLKILMRIIAKNLRIGMSDKTMDLFFSVPALGGNNGENKNVRGGSMLSSINNQYYFIEPMLAKPLKSVEDVFEFCGKKEQKYLIADVKYDGERTLICYERGKQFFLTSRRRKSQQEVHSVLYNHLREELDLMTNIQSIKIDGQILCLAENGQPLPMSMVRSKAANTDANSSNKLVFAFDALQYNGVSLLNYPLSQRRKVLPQSSHLQISQYLQFTYPEQREKLVDFYKQAISKKFQGLIIKGKDDPYYTNGTRRMWGKFKRGCRIDETSTGVIDLDLVVMGVIYGQGKRSQYFATYLLGAYLGEKVYPLTRIGTGFTEEQLAEFTELFKEGIVEEKPKQYEMPSKLSVSHYVEPQYVFQVHCQEFTRSPLYQIGYMEGVGGLSLRFPVFVCLREDKQPKSCTVDDILQYAGNI